jgi:DNA-binding transcriptional LysR family regulator
MRLVDLSVFLTVARTGSITGAARQLSVTPSNVSKAIARLENQLRATLLFRGPRGISLTDAGRRILPDLEDVVSRLRRITSAERAATPELRIAASSCVSLLVLPAVAGALPGYRLRSLELPPALARVAAAENVLDVVLAPSAEGLPERWERTKLGDFDKRLLGAPALATALGPGSLPREAVRDVPFVGLSCWANGQIVEVDDGCPIRRADRKAGHEAQTVSLALDLAARTGQIVFAPLFAARAHLAAGTLIELTVDCCSITEPLWLGCDGDRVLARVQKTIVDAVATSLAGEGPALTPRRGRA